MKNIHLLPTDKPSIIYLIKSNNKLGITSNNPEFTENFGSGTQNQHIYITSDEEIKEGDWCLDLMNNKIYVATKVVVHNLKSLEYEEYLKKIILTTDAELIKDGVQTIDDDFLEWFVKNPSCEEVETKKGYKNAHSSSTISEFYKIIIPKEETKQEGYICPHTLLQCDDECCVSAEDCHIKEWTYLSEPKQETLEEVAERYYQDEVSINGFINGYKLAKEQTIYEVFEWLTTNNYLTDLKETLIKNFNNFKTK
jgi:hypothetical protein